MRVLLVLALLLVGSTKAQSSFVVADSLYATGNYIRAINQYAKEGSSKSQLQIARAYNAMGNYDRAIAQYESVVAKDENLQIARLELGKLYLKTKQYDDARKLYTKLVLDNNKNPGYFYYLGEAHRELNAFSSSLVAYKNAIGIDSTHLRSLFRLGKYFVVNQENYEALGYINKGLRFYENDVSLINLKALALFNNNEYEKAIPFFEKLLVLGEHKPHVYNKLAQCYFKEWEFEKAKKKYHSLILMMNETDPDPYFNLAGVFLKEKVLDSARFYIKKSIEIKDPSFYREYRSLASIAREEKDLKVAFDYYKLTCKEEPSDFMAFYQVCTLADQLYKDPKLKLGYYQDFIEKFGNDKRYFSNVVKKRILELKEEIHFTGN